MTIGETERAADEANRRIDELTKANRILSATILDNENVLQTTMEHWSDDTDRYATLLAWSQAALWWLEHHSDYLSQFQGFTELLADAPSDVRDTEAA